MESENMVKKEMRLLIKGLTPASEGRWTMNVRWLHVGTLQMEGYNEWRLRVQLQ
jgi:hypothetical protein